jgi:nitrite reductase/ring-hydroxylating ferredoxin subunit
MTQKERHAKFKKLEKEAAAVRQAELLLDERRSVRAASGKCWHWKKPLTCEGQCSRPKEFGYLTCAHHRSDELEARAEEGKQLALFGEEAK